MDAQRRKILQISSYPPPQAGWGVRVQFLKKYLEGQGHDCVVLNIGTSRRIPSPEYETVMDGWDYLRKVWRFSRAGYVAHLHANGEAPKGMMLAVVAGLLNLLCGERCFLTFHGGIDQVYFPRERTPLVLTPLLRLMFAIPRRIICNSEEVRAKIVGYGVDPKKIIPIAAFSTQYVHFKPTALPEAAEAFYRRFTDVLFCYIRIRQVFYPLVLIEAFAKLTARNPHMGLVLCGVSGHMEDVLWEETQALIRRLDLEDRILVIDDLSHDQFLSALSRSSVCVRTHVSDGVCSSVLESLTLGTPVVACENGMRPPGVATYPPAEPDRLAGAVESVLKQRKGAQPVIPRPELRDTLHEEATLLTASSNGRRMQWSGRWGGVLKP